MKYYKNILNDIEVLADSITHAWQLFKIIADRENKPFPLFNQIYLK